jgi:voltage-gated potassium channel
VRLVVGLLVFAGVVVWGVRIIAGSRYPGAWAAEALALVLPFFLLLFASTYFVMERNSAASFTQPLTRARTPCTSR